MGHAVVTGSEGGIGRAICQAFQDAGFEVIGIDRLKAERAPWPTLTLDLVKTLREEEAARQLVSEISRRSGGGLDVLVNNAAVQIRASVSELRYADWQDTLETNLTVPFLLVQRLLPLLRRAHGCVVNLSSIHASQTKAGFSAYAASKGGLASLTRALAVELAPEVRVNSVVPAAIDTAMLRAGFEGDRAGLEASTRPESRASPEG